MRNKSIEIEEMLISIETAKLAKKKGFNVEINFNSDESGMDFLNLTISQNNGGKFVNHPYPKGLRAWVVRHKGNRLIRGLKNLEK